MQDSQVNHSASCLSRSPEEVLTVLAAGGVIAYPTEAVYGLGCRAELPAPVERIRALKERAPSQGVLVLVDDLARVKDWLQPLTAKQEERLTLSWPGSITWLIPAADTCPRWLRGDSGRLAVRIPEHDLCRHLCRELGAPLVSTSANPAGRPPARSAQEVATYFPQGLDLILDAPLGGRSQPSSIRDLVTGEVIRPG